MFTYCFNNECICIFISLLLYFTFFMTNAAKRIVRSGTIKCYCIALHCIALHCIALHCIALHCIALHCIALHCIALHCIALHCIVQTRVHRSPCIYHTHEHTVLRTQKMSKNAPLLRRLRTSYCNNWQGRG